MAPPNLPGLSYPPQREELGDTAIAVSHFASGIAHRFATCAKC